MKKEEVIEGLRKNLVGCMLHGKPMIINVETLRPNFNLDFTCLEFPPEIFNYSEWRKEANFLKVVHDDENVSMMGDKGNFYMNENFTIVLLAKYKDDADCADWLSKIPHSD